MNRVRRICPDGIGKCPVIGTSPGEGRWPKTPFTNAGTRTEPPMSEPSAIGAPPEPTITPSPPDDPPPLAGCTIAAKIGCMRASLTLCCCCSCSARLVMCVLSESPESPPLSPLARNKPAKLSGPFVVIPRLSPFFLQRQHRVSLFRRQRHQLDPAKTLAREKPFHPANAFGRHP